MTTQEEKELDQLFYFLESAQSEYLDKNSEKFKRSRFEILGDTLVGLEDGEPMTATKMIRKNMTSDSPRFKELISLLMKKGYIEHYKMPHSRKHYYDLTDLGFKAAELYKRAKSLFVE